MTINMAHLGHDLQLLCSSNFLGSCASVHSRAQLKFVCSELALKTLEKGVKTCSKLTIKTPERRD